MPPEYFWTDSCEQYAHIVYNLDIVLFPGVADPDPQNWGTGSSSPKDSSSVPSSEAASSVAEPTAEHDAVVLGFD